MNRGRKAKSLRTVRLGDVLIDDQRRLILLCRSCARHFVTFDSYEKHLKNCPGIKHIVTPIDQLSYDEAKKETRFVNGRQELNIYDIEAVRSVNQDLSSDIDWEAELEDPRWYTDDSLTKSKENVSKKRKAEEVPARTKTQPVIVSSTPNRPILTAQQQQQRRMRVSVPPPANPAPHVTLPTAKTKKEVVLEAKLSTIPPPMVTIPIDDTQQILNKLRACGVEVKRGNTRLDASSNVDPKQTQNQQTMDIMRKLQSKGIQCTKVNKNLNN